MIFEVMGMKYTRDRDMWIRARVAPRVLHFSAFIIVGNDDCRLLVHYSVSVHTRTHTHTHTSWLYHEPEATVCTVGETISTAEKPPTSSTNPNQLSPSDADMNYISVRTILTEAAFGKFQAKFANTVRMIELNVNIDS